MPNICAVRTLQERPAAFNYAKKDWWLPHEPTLVTPTIRLRAIEHCQELGLGLDSVMDEGEEIRQSGLHWCRHCGSCYGEGE